MSRDAAIDRAMRLFDDGTFLEILGRRVAIPTESQNPDRLPDLKRYLDDEIGPSFAAMGHSTRVYANPVAGGGPVLLAERIEDEALPTVLGYGHGDVVLGDDANWREGLSPWKIQRDGEKLYGRGTADNKGQHTINMLALETVLAERGHLGFNSKFMVETGEENGSAGVREVIEANQADFAANVFIASDGPRVAADRPTITLGNRGARNFDLVVDMREGGHHSGNWGGLLSNPGIILAHALATIISPKGRVLVPGLLPTPIPNSVRAALRDVTLDGGPGAPEIDPNWGEPGLTPVERLYAWNTFEVLAFTTGTPGKPVNAVPPNARANCQIRFVVGSKPDEFVPVLRKHLDEHGFGMVKIEPPPASNAGEFAATRTDPDSPWAKWAAETIASVSGKKTAVVPNSAGSICNDLFSDLLGMPTIWVPHSYSACSQHAPNEHILLAEAREALAIMTGLYWDLGEKPPRG